MLHAVLLILYEYLWVAALYTGIYWGAHVFMRDHSRILKVSFDVDLRYFAYNTEEGTQGQHALLHTVAATLAGALLAVNPVVHSAIFFWFKFMDVTQLNRLALYITFLQLARPVNLLNRSAKFHTADAFLAFQLVYTSLNFWNRHTILPTTFYLVDELGNVPLLAEEVYRVHQGLLGGDDSFSTRVLSWQVWFAGRRAALRAARVTLLGALVLLSVIYGDFSTWAEVVFYYAAAGRVVWLYTEKEPDKIH
jgi:hypothetical protein